MDSTRLLPVSDANIGLAVELLRRGEVVAFPTETVYGLGADASNPEAVQKIFAAKGRPSDHPLIVHIAADADPLQWAAQWPEAAQRLVSVFWPGPLTLILKRAAHVPDAVTGGQDTVGLRCPGHPDAQRLLSAFGGALAAPSANRFGRISPTSASHVFEELSGRIPLILDGGHCAVGIESTIIDLSRGFPVLLRPGDVSIEAIAGVLGQMPARPDAQAPRVSGALEQHYAPGKPLQLVHASALQDVLAVVRISQCSPVAVIGWSEPFLNAARACGFGASLNENGQLLVMTNDVHRIAHDLYAVLRQADHLPVKSIFCEQPQGLAIWEGVQDRLKRASA